MHETPQVIHNILAQWDCLAFTAYDYYVKFGRIILGITQGDAGSDHPMFMAILCSQENKISNPSISAMLSSFNPEQEILVQFEDTKGNLRTQRLRTRQGSSTPKSIYAREMMDRYEQNPESVDFSQLPSWLKKLLSTLPPARFS